MVGAHVAAKVDVSNHRYNSTFGFTDQFGFVTSGFGALVRTTRKVGRGVISNDLAVPLASWVDFPYANIKVNGDALHLRFAGLRTLQAFDESISYWLSPSGRASVGWTYRVTYLRYHGDDVRRFARQSLMAVVRVRLNGTEP